MPSARRHRWRLTTRGLVFLTGLVSVGLLAGRETLPAVMSALSPYVVAGSAIATRSPPTLFWLGLVVGGWAVARRRSFCQWLCPTGLVLDGAGQVGRICGRPSVPRRRWGSWLTWLTLGGALVGLPLFLWLDPMAILTSTFSVSRSDAGNARWYAGGALVLLLLLNTWRPGQWCRQLCPLGGLQDDLFLGGQALRARLRGEIRPTQASRDGVSSRRAWFGTAGGAVLGMVLPRAQTALPVIRPPGSVAEPSFNAVCVRCGNCLRACPSGIIRSSGAEAGWLGLFTPSLSFTEDYCREDCVRCGAVCPSGALQPLALNQKAALNLGQPAVRIDLCLLTQERECSHCRNWCPYGAVSYVFSEETYTLEPRVNFDQCNGCGACEAHCPVQPVKAIAVQARKP